MQTGCHYSASLTLHKPSRSQTTSLEWSQQANCITVMPSFPHAQQALDSSSKVSSLKRTMKSWAMAWGHAASCPSRRVAHSRVRVTGQRAAVHGGQGCGRRAPEGRWAVGSGQQTGLLGCCGLCSCIGVTPQLCHSSVTALSQPRTHHAVLDANDPPLVVSQLLKRPGGQVQVGGVTTACVELREVVRETGSEKGRGQMAAGHARKTQGSLGLALTPTLVGVGVAACGGHQGRGGQCG
jgi:hypothetical protein